MKKIYKLVVFFILAFCFIKDTEALNLISEQIKDVWYTRRGGSEGYFSADYNIYSIDGKTTYCIEPGIHITTKDYLDASGLIASPYKEEINKKLELIGYYGYDYPGHQTLHYRMATQALIWETAGNNIVEYWTKPSGEGDYINIDKEKKEILNLVEKHNIVPSFSNTTKDVIIGDTITFTDNNNALENFEIVSNGDIDYEFIGNQIKVTPKNVGNIEFTLRRKSYTNNGSTVFVGIDNVSQKMGYFGLSDRQECKFKLNVRGAKIKVIKFDKDNSSIIPQGDAVLKGAVYGIYNMLDQKIEELTIGDDSSAISNYLPELGTYYLKELVPSKGYSLDELKYYFTVTKSNLNSTVYVYENVIKRKINLYKVFANSKSGVLTAEPNITFAFYLKSNMSLVTTKTTDINGQISLTLPYGTYVVKQLNSPLGYEKAEDFEIVVDENADEVITKIVANNKMGAKLKIIKVDAESGKMIKNKNIKFKIKNLDTGKYVCQKITYPNEKDICVFETKDGYFITPYNLDYGNYQIEEIDQLIDGYTWNDKPLKFSIDENSEFIYDKEYGTILEVKFTNKEVKGKVFIQKFGEKLRLDKNTYYYDKIKLDDVIFMLYADEDIYSADGTLIYKKGDFIKEYVTKDGKITIEDLYLGSYYLIEKKTYLGHVLDPLQYHFTLNYKDQYTEIVEEKIALQNYLSKGTLKFYKKDAITGNFLPNTKIKIFTYTLDPEDAILIYEGYTDEFGNITIPDLFVGKYYLIESESPMGYLLNNDKMFFEIKENGEIINLEMTNDMIQVEVPKTYESSNIFLIISIILVTLFSTGIIVYEKKV